MGPLAIGGLAAGLIGGIGGLFGGRRARKQMEAVMKTDPRYKVNPLAQQRLGLAQTLLNARMPGSSQMTQNIYGAQAGQLANINRGATDSSQALALAAGVQGQTNQAFGQLGQMQSQDYYNRLDNLTGAQQGMISEGDKVYQDEVRRFDNRASAAGANVQNQQNSWNSLSNLGFGMMNLGLSGGMQGLFGGGGARKVPGATTSTNQNQGTYGRPIPLY